MITAGGSRCKWDADIAIIRSRIHHDCGALRIWERGEAVCVFAPTTHPQTARCGRFWRRREKKPPRSAREAGSKRARATQRKPRSPPTRCPTTAARLLIMCSATIATTTAGAAIQAGAQHRTRDATSFLRAFKRGRAHFLPPLFLINTHLVWAQLRRQGVEDLPERLTRVHPAAADARERRLDQGRGLLINELCRGPSQHRARHRRLSVRSR